MAERLGIIAPISTRIGPGLHSGREGSIGEYVAFTQELYRQRRFDEMAHHEALWGKTRPFESSARNEALWNSVKDAYNRSIFVIDPTSPSGQNRPYCDPMVVIVTEGDCSAIGTPVSYPYATIMVHKSADEVAVLEALERQGMHRSKLVPYEIDPVDLIDILAYGFLCHGWTP